eukprot:207927-Ditylum_brightwellii.AAC.1
MYPKTISRRYPVKLVYMGAVAPPNESKDFDELRGKWKSLIDNVEIMIMKDLRDTVKNAYNVDDEQSSKLMLHYYSYKGSGKIISNYIKDKNEWFSSKERCIEDQSTHPLTLTDCTLKVHVLKGSFLGDDLSCDSKFM